MITAPVDGELIAGVPVAGFDLSLGARSTYCRALPRVLRRLRTERALEQVDRVVSARDAASRSTAASFWDGASYFERDEHAL